MQQLSGKKIILAVTGGIAAYKSPLLVRLLVKAGAEVRVVMTPDAEQFVTRQTLSVVSGNEVWSGFFNQESVWNNHVKLALWADVFIVAPATASSLAKMAHGLCDNLVMAVYMSMRNPVMIAPAMDEDMYLHFSTEDNIKLLTEKGALIVPPATGELASGLNGIGRMAEPEEIFATIVSFFNPLYKGKKVLVNAGPTHEPIDPVRFIGNRSSGKMGISLAEAFAQMGAEVTLVLGPTDIRPKGKIKVERVSTAAEMHEATMKHFKSCDVFVAAAAVADYSVENPATSKIKKTGESLSLSLVKNPDILADCGRIKRAEQLVVGFALETDTIEENAKKKLEAKNADVIVINSPNNIGEGFGYDTNRVTVLDRHNKKVNFELMHKRELAMELARLLHGYLK